MADPKPARGSVERELAHIVDEARAAVAAGRDPGLAALEERVRALAESAGERTVGSALQALERVASVQRARTLLSQRPAEPAAAPTRLKRAALRTRPTITANMDVRRERAGDAFSLVWDAAPAVVAWEVRLSERTDARSDYVVVETRTLEAGATRVEIPLGDRLLRVHLLGRARDGRLVRRAVISALAEANWNDAWQRRASAS